MSEKLTTGRRVHRLEDIELPGDYFGPTVRFTGGAPAVFFLKPNARDKDTPLRGRSLQHVCYPPHTFAEQKDGSLVITPSISEYPAGSPCTPEFSDGWHGYLEAGNVWRQV